jgi:Uma2 family endonuclease
MLSHELQQLPSSYELPDSDDAPVDNEDQNLLPNILLFLLNTIWADREDWFFGVDMGIYHTTGVNPRVPVVPDGFLSLGVQRRKGGKSRPSYVMWEENQIVPRLVLEVVSQIPGKEYNEKLEIYTQLGVLYYVIYNPEYWRRDGHQPFEVYKLVDGVYRLEIGEPYWMEEVGLGIGRYQKQFGSVEIEVLGWCDRQGNRYLTAEELAEREHQRAEQESQRADQERQRAEQERLAKERLMERLKAMGVDLDALD